MADGDANELRRRLLRNAGALAGGLTVLGASTKAGAEGSGPVPSGGERLPRDGESVGEDHPACEEPTSEPSASDPNERYRELLEQALDMRDSNEPSIQYDAIGDVLRDRSGEFDGDLILFAASDFGAPRVFLPESLSEPNAALGSILERVHEQKWRARNAALRDVRDEVFEGGYGLHQVLAGHHHNGNGEYDIDFPWNRTYNFVTIRQAVGMVDWVTNAQDPWLDGLRRTY